MTSIKEISSVCCWTFKEYNIDKNTYFSEFPQNDIYMHGLTFSFLEFDFFLSSSFVSNNMLREWKKILLRINYRNQKLNWINIKTFKKVWAEKRVSSWFNGRTKLCKIPSFFKDGILMIFLTMKFSAIKAFAMMQSYQKKRRIPNSYGIIQISFNNQI